MNNDLITRTLASLDAAPVRALDDATRRRADARLHQILTSDPVTPTTPVLASRRRAWITVTAGAAAVVAIGGALTVGALAPSDAAFASWTATPDSLTSSEQGLAGTACLDAAGRPGADVILAERRGEWIAVAAVSDASTHVTCLVHLPSGSTDADTVLSAQSGGQGAIPVGGEINEGSLSEFAEWTFPGTPASPTASFTIGDAGPDVAAVDIITPDGDVVSATVEDGRYLAWWPGKVFVSTDEDVTVLDLAYRVTLEDGTVIEDAQPISPE
ncbi:hypothetical protein CLV49_1686 [Labedella gwakjiensis]|uniref:Uncharacterized protein n=1 Tax=Labedella gwakjiensis TaxID=390269 RepID=A0A2P8GVT5_9MICO|nr:hypothetical protein [Labedella gwakjiensis]PSL38074.1 hypothetical protein CLV49_1686 [Labedella gwakjiensis]RUQ87368.1 hypothetical protein ELQ93_10770 [Labedella gwakjiensis]